MRVLSAVLLVCLAVSVIADVSVPFTDCGTTADIGKITSITANIFPPTSGIHMDMHQVSATTQNKPMTASGACVAMQYHRLAIFCDIDIDEYVIFIIVPRKVRLCYQWYL